MRYHGFIDDDGKTYDKEMDQSDEEYAYQLGLGQCDPDYLKAEAERLYKEVIAQYGRRSSPHRQDSRAGGAFHASRNLAGTASC